MQRNIFRIVCGHFQYVYKVNVSQVCCIFREQKRSFYSASLERNEGSGDSSRKLIIWFET